jgi:hypothetical protein
MGGGLIMGLAACFLSFFVGCDDQLGANGDSHRCMPGSETSGHEAADKIPSWELAERAYNRVLTTLWISNAGATLATLAYITANRHDGTFTRSLLVPLVLFTLGLTIPGMSSLVEFECARRAVLRSRASWTMRDRGTDAVRGAEQLEFALKWRTPTALASGTCFAAGFVYGFAMLVQK